MEGLGIQIAYMFPAGQAVNVKIFIQTDNFAYACFFCGNNKRSIGKVHGDIRIFLCKLHKPGYIVLVYIGYDNTLLHYPLKKILLGISVYAQKVRNLGKNRKCGYKRKVIFFKKVPYSFVMIITNMKKSDKRA